MNASAALAGGYDDARAEVSARSPFQASELPLCAHCGLLVAGGRADGQPLYCCSGCALAHRLTGAQAGHGQAVGMLMAVGVGAFLALNVMMLSFVLYSGGGEADRAAGETWVRAALLLLATPALVLLGAPFLARGLRRLRARSLDTDVLIVIGVGAAYVLSARSVWNGHGPLYLDTAMGILLFVTVGRYLEAAARARATDALAALASRLPREACRVRDGRDEQVRVEDLVPGDVLRVRPGERLPVDGEVLAGEASVAEAELTGESLPAHKRPGERVSAGTLNLDGALVIVARQTGADTLLARLARRVEQARAGRAPLAPLSDRVVAVFVPAVLLLAGATCAYWSWRADVGVGVLNALSVLLIACPCSIGIATPLAASAAAGRAALHGVLVRSGETFERLARARRVLFDKTGTLTCGQPELLRVAPALGVADDDVLGWAVALEAHSEHVLAGAVRAAAAARGVVTRPQSGFRAWPGRGVSGRVAARLDDAPELGPLVRLGTADFVGDAPPCAEPGVSFVHVSVDGRWRGALAFHDALRPSAAEALQALQARGLALEVLSGDQPEAVAAVAASLPGLTARGGLRPEDKLRRVGEAIARGEAPVMVGDGINDAPALSGAAVGVTLESGTDLAREVADVTLLGGDLRRLPWLIDLSAATLRTARFNLAWGFGYNTVGLVLAAQGRLHPLFGAVAMVASSLFVVLQAQRLTRLPLPGEP